MHPVRHPRWAACLLALLLALCLAMVPVRVAVAEGDADGARVGSVTLLLGDGSGSSQTDMVGGTVVLYRVAGVRRTSGERYDVSQGQFATSGTAKPLAYMDQDELDAANPDVSARLEAEAERTGVSPFATAAVESGQAVFPQVPEGLYLVCQTEMSQGYRKTNAFLLSVPGEDGELDVVAQPKLGIYTDPDGEGGGDDPGSGQGTEVDDEEPGDDGTDDTDDGDGDGTDDAGDGSSASPSSASSGSTGSAASAGDASSTRTTVSAGTTSDASSIGTRVPQTGDDTDLRAGMLLVAAGLAGMGLGARVRRRAGRGDVA